MFCYFDNDAKVHAPFDALALMQRLGLAEGVRVRPADAVGEDARAGWPAISSRTG